MRLEPRAGHNLQANSLWGRELPAVPGDDTSARLLLSIAYPMVAPERAGLLTPFAEVALNDNHDGLQRLGLEWQPGAEIRLRIGIENPADPEFGVNLAARF